MGEELTTVSPLQARLKVFDTVSKLASSDRIDKVVALLRSYAADPGTDIDSVLYGDLLFCLTLGDRITVIDRCFGEHGSGMLCTPFLRRRVKTEYEQFFLAASALAGGLFGVLTPSVWWPVDVVDTSKQKHPLTEMKRLASESRMPEAAVFLDIYERIPVSKADSWYNEANQLLIEDILRQAVDGLGGEALYWEKQCNKINQLADDYLRYAMLCEELSSVPVGEW